MLPILSEIQQYNNSMFDCVSAKNEYVVKSTSTELLDYMVTLYPRNENIGVFDFVYGFINYTHVAFAKNQSDVIHLATEMFANSEPLGDFESNILNKTFRRLIKVHPTLSGRK
jgi:hypothetical protein